MKFSYPKNLIFLTIVFALFSVSCTTFITEPEFANFENSPNYRKVMPEFRDNWPEQLSLDQSVVMEIGFSKTTAIGLCSFDAKNKDISLALITTTGMKLLEAVRRSGKTETLFSIPELAKREAAGKQLIEDVDTIYIHPEIKYSYYELRKNRLIYCWEDGAKNRTELIFGKNRENSELMLMSKKVYFDNSPISIVYYSDYKEIRGKKIPMTIGLLNKKFGYSILIRTKKVYNDQN